MEGVMTYNIDVVTNALLYACGQRRIEVSNLKLQKLLYYSQGWYLALAKRPLFVDDFDAWVHGPAVPGVFRRFKTYRWGAITESGTSGDAHLHGYLNSLLDSYGTWSAKQLESLTHVEKPWLDARIGLAVDEP